MSGVTPLPSVTAYVVAGAILAGTIGYFLGQASSIGFFGPSTGRPDKKQRKGKKSKESWPNSYDVTIHPDSSDEELMAKLRAGDGAQAEDSDMSSSEDEEDDESGDIASFAGHNEEHKLVLVVRTDLGMGKGKIAAQCSHATLACYMHITKQDAEAPVLKRWFMLGQAKIAVQCKSEDELLTLQATALSLGLCARVIRDAGRTQIASGSATVLGIGPGPKSVVDKVTGNLKLL